MVRYFQKILKMSIIKSISCVLKIETSLNYLAKKEEYSLHPWDQEVSWTQHPSSSTLYHHGRVGIGTDQGREALTVASNIQVVDSDNKYCCPVLTTASAD